jgi:PAS domain S-box-containing protein
MNKKELSEEIATLRKSLELNENEIDNLNKEIEKQKELISKLEGLEKAKFNADEQNKILVENSPFSIELYDTDGTMLQANRAWETFWNQKRENVIGKFNALKDPMIKKLGLLPHIEKAFRGEEGEITETEYISPDNPNTKRWLRTRYFPLKDETGKLKRVVVINEDITERKQAQFERDRMFNLSLDMLCISSFDGFIRQINPAWQKSVGWSNVDMMNKNWVEFIHPNDQHATSEANDKLLKGESLSQFENRFRAQDGTYRWFSWDSYPLREEKLIFSVIRDITERKMIEAELQASLSNYTSLFNAEPDAIIIMNSEDRKIINANKSAREMYGYTHDEFLELDALTLSAEPEKSLQHIQEAVKRASQNTSPQISVRIHKKKDGTKFPVEITYGFYIHKFKRLICAIIRDISDRTTTEYELIQSEKKFRSIFEDSYDCIYLTDSENKIVDINNAGLKLFGYRKNEVMDSNSLKFFANKIDSERFWAEIEKEGFVKDYSAKLLNKNKEEFDCLITNFVRRDENGSIVGYQGIIKDFTKQKNAELELIKAKEDAEKADRLKSEFLTQISHEIRTPINTLLSFSSLIREEIKDNLNDQLQEYFAYQVSAGSRIINTIDMILNMSEIQTGSFKTNSKRINLYEIINSVYSEYLIIADAQGIELKLFVSDNVYPIYADEYSVHQIFRNLIDNSIKYTPSGEISINLTNKNNYAKVEVTDTGIGIAEEYLKDIFEPFTQEEQGYTRKFEGAGLGLALVKKYCDLNNANIKVDSKKGSGTQFIVSFEIMK